MDPNITGEVEIQLDKPRVIKYGTFTQFRLSRHQEHLGESWNYQQVLTYIWAMLPKEALTRFPDPEDLGEFITPDNLAGYMDSLLKAMTLAFGDGPEKKSNSKRGRSTASKSG